ncbi:glycine--tRNA ligase subunit alpha [Blochmannia endosymbiont of Polyrhachis (Hedomyrma) turneri]|uniref:glycine--tRNA ligase subunit alpha n=1 Tax=Blochmannia endosymbiont of Polyrhachis (Hedomyrma) turneri TaxID=1505596 RepID=UPI00061A84D7|nr:glycine--tRNA ligase subunit alpha [Blochmannia endosymbiont of Polyrhachis (Hedomyrma) turneri]AKC59617.1 Glycine-tRNA ligase alpha subunit [Blochmannia endosymbiont of Polyrhachis (Hedomyrma) turneri]
MENSPVKTFQELVFDLQSYWRCHGCMIAHSFDMEIGAATSHPITFLRAIGPEPICVAYIQASRRPVDSRYAKNPNKLQHYYQFQVIMKPPPENIQDLYLVSLKSIGLDIMDHDIKFIEDNWSNPTLGAWGVGWEVWLDGMEITQFTYFQQVGGLECNPVMAEITYGLERLAMSLQKVDNVYNIVWDNYLLGPVTYGDIFFQNELEQSQYNLEYVDVNFLFMCFAEYEKQVQYLIHLEPPLSIPAYEYILKLVHVFNLLESRKVISVMDRQNYILRICNLTKIVAGAYYLSRKSLGFPMCVNDKIR